MNAKSSYYTTNDIEKIVEKLKSKYFRLIINFSGSLRNFLKFWKLVFEWKEKRVIRFIWENSSKEKRKLLENWLD